jgi:hypothetical protein
LKQYRYALYAAASRYAYIKMQIVRRKVTWHVCGGGNNPRGIFKMEEANRV